MGDEKINLKISIAQRNIELTIPREHEHYYREAEKIINDSFYAFAKKWAYKDHQDLLSKILLHQVVNGIEREDRLRAFEEDLIPKMEAIKKITDQFEIN